MRQLVYTMFMFISNNRESFQLWGKENLVKQQKVSKYYGNDGRCHISRCYGTTNPIQRELSIYCTPMSRAQFTYNNAMTLPDQVRKS